MVRTVATQPTITGAIYDAENGSYTIFYKIEAAPWLGVLAQGGFKPPKHITNAATLVADEFEAVKLEAADHSIMLHPTVAALETSLNGSQPQVVARILMGVKGEESPRYAETYLSRGLNEGAWLKRHLAWLDNQHDKLKIDLRGEHAHDD